MDGQIMVKCPGELPFAIGLHQPNPRSTFSLAPVAACVCLARPPPARVVELVDTQVSEACA